MFIPIQILRSDGFYISIDIGKGMFQPEMISVF